MFMDRAKNTSNDGGSDATGNGDESVAGEESVGGGSETREEPRRPGQC